MLLLCIFYTILMSKMKVTYLRFPTPNFFFFFFENINPIKYKQKIKHIVSSCLEDHENNTTCFL